MNIFEGSFENWEDVESAFEFNSEGDVYPIFAAYDIDGYEGSAVVLFIEHGNLYLNEGSHCSCYGLENQWEPELLPWEIAETVLQKSWHLDRYKQYVLPLVREIAVSDDREMDIRELMTFCKLKYN
jgi:hypothetical protein